MNILESIDKYKIRGEFKPILTNFFEMKQSVYHLKDTDIEQKIRETMCNIRDIKYTNKTELDIVYSYIKNEIIIGKDISIQIKKNGLNYNNIQCIFHELSYAYDSIPFSNSKRKTFIVDGEKIKIKPMLKQGIHPFENGVLKTSKYALLDECLNEAKTEILLQIGNNSPKLIFNEYQELQPVFETLCAVNNMKYLEFLKNIEGKDINEISTIMSLRNGNPKDETDKYLENLAECCEKMYTNISYCTLTYNSSDEEKRKYMEDSFKEYEKLYNFSKIYIYNANITDKDLRYDKLNIIQNKVKLMFFHNNDPRFEKYKIKKSSINIDNEAPEYDGNRLAISGIIIDSNNKNFWYKNRDMNFIQRIKNKFINNRPLLKENNNTVNEGSKI